MKKIAERYWIAFCVGYDSDNKKVLASCLTFWASNRFYALQAVEKMLPEHDNWVREDGGIWPHQLYTLEQCRPEEAEDRAFFYLHAFCEVAQIDPAEAHLVA